MPSEPPNGSLRRPSAGTTADGGNDSATVEVRTPPLASTAPATLSASIYRKVFVGREHELTKLRTAFAEALSGQGSLVVVVGEPGIGKTALCEQLTAHVAAAGGCTLRGSCYEEGSLPYLPFVEALRSPILEHETATLQGEMGPGAPHIARIVPELRERLHVGPPEPGSNPEEDRWQLFEAVTSFLANLAHVRPLMLVLEDLHWADRGTLELLRHLVRSLPGAKLLVVATYRDVEVDRAHPLSEALADLRRTAPFARVHLQGLGANEVGHMLSQLAGVELPGPMGELVHRQTEGNPLFVQEAFRHLVEEGVSLRAAPAAPDTVRSFLEALPEGLRDVIARRFSRLSEDCNRMLAVAAVIGRELPLDVLREVVALPEDALYSALEEAVGKGIVEEQRQGGSLSYRFSHAFLRQALYEQIFTPRRMRLHLQVARAIEKQYAARLEEHAAALAGHFSHSNDPEDLEKAVTYGERAASSASAVFAFSDAARHLERALQALEGLGSQDNVRRCALLLSLGECLLRTNEGLRVCDEIAPQACALAEALGDRKRAAEACWMAIQGLHVQFAATVLAGGQQWAERLDRLAPDDTMHRVHADIAMGLAVSTTADFKEADRRLTRALALARTLHAGPDTLQSILGMYIQTCQGPCFDDRRRAFAKEAASLATSSQQAPGPMARPLLQGVLPSLYWASAEAMVWGDRAEEERLARIQVEVLKRTSSPEADRTKKLYECAFAYLDGEVERAAAIAERALFSGETPTRPSVMVNYAVAAFRPLQQLGRSQEPLLEVMRSHRMSIAPQVLLIATLGRHDEARALVRRVLGERPLTLAAALDSWPSYMLAAYLEAAVLMGDVALAGWFAAPLWGTQAVTTSRYNTIIQRQLGSAAALLGEPEKARNCFERAIEQATRMPFRPEVALTRLQLAELLLEHFPADRDEARDHLGVAIAEFEAMNMAPSLEKALALQRRANGASRPSHSRTPHPDGLSEREVEVLRLVAAGLTNQQIADTLVISPATVAHHVSNIFGKTGLNNRTEAAAYAIRQNVVH